jgi:hypothetical protein
VGRVDIQVEEVFGCIFTNPQVTYCPGGTTSWCAETLLDLTKACRYGNNESILTKGMIQAKGTDKILN